MPHHGIWHTIPTRHGARRIRARARREVLIEIVEAYEETGHHGETAKRVGLKRRRVSSYLGKLGLTGKDPLKGEERITYRHEPTGGELRTIYKWGAVHKAVNLYWRDGLPTREIEDEMGIPSYTIWNWMDTLGIARSAGQSYKETTARRLGFDSRADLKGEMQRLRAAHDCTVEEIAQAIGCSRHLVSSILDGRYKSEPHIMRKRTRERRRISGKEPYPYSPGPGDMEAKAERKEKVRAMREEGVKPLRIAERLDVSVATIYNDLQAA